MRALVLALALLAAAPAHAACYADYKAKQEPPLRLHYGVIELPDGACTPSAARAEVARRLAAHGWTLLNIVGIFGPEGLEARRSDAGAHFLRY
ncbi:MAG: hypothetical protein ACK4KW_09070 [Gemmobacter sp.]